MIFFYQNHFFLPSIYTLVGAGGGTYGAEGLAYIAHSIHRGYLTFTV